MIKDNIKIIVRTVIITICILAFFFVYGYGLFKSNKVEYNEVQAAIDEDKFYVDLVHQKGNLTIYNLKDKETGVEYIYTVYELYQKQTTQIQPRLDLDGSLHGRYNK